MSRPTPPLGPERAGVTGAGAGTGAATGAGGGGGGASTFGSGSGLGSAAGLAFGSRHGGLATGTAPPVAGTGGAAETTWVGAGSRLATSFTSTAPAVTITAAAMPAAAFEATVPMPAEIAPPARCAAGGGGRTTGGQAGTPRPRLRRRRRRPPAAAPPPKPSLARPSFLRNTKAPTGKTAASALEVWRSCARKSRQRSQALRWRRTGAELLVEALGHLAELEPDLLAGEQPRLGGLGQAHACAHEQRLHARHRGVHRLGDLVVGERVDLAQQQCGALGLGQLLHVGHDLAELLAAVHGLGGGGAVVALEDVHRVLPGRARLAQVVQAAVARDPVEPRARVDRPVVGSSALYEAAKTSWSTSSASSCEPSMWRQKASSRGW